MLKKIILAIFLIIILSFSIIFIKLYIDGKIVRVGKVREPIVECNTVDSLLNYLNVKSNLRADRNVSLKELHAQDKRNMEILVSLFEQCGLGKNEYKLSFENCRTIWIILHHYPESKYLKKYFHLIKKMYNNRQIPAEFYALSTDRLLSDENKPQLYGTQLDSNGKLYKYDNLDSLILRRKLLGLVPLDDYIKKVNNLNK